MYSLRDIQRIAQNAPDNLIFCSTETLLKYCGKTRFNPEPCIAELFARWLLKQDDTELKDALSKLLSEHIVTTVFNCIYGDIFSSNFVQIPDEALWTIENTFQQKCEKAIRSRLISLFQQTEGFIPIFIGENGFFLPFHFEQAEDRPEIPLICDNAGKKIANWDKAYYTLFDEHPPFRCIIHCEQDLMPYPLTGQSFMLPVYLAALRKQEKLFYDPRRLIASGEIRNRSLVAVELETKIKSFSDTFSRNAFFLCPESDLSAIDALFILPLKEGINHKQLTEKIERYIEIHSLGMPSFQYALNRLQKLTEEVRHDTHKQWQNTLKRLDSNSKAIPAYRTPENYLLCLMLRGAIYCHMGDTENAKKWNSEAQQFANDNGFQKQLLRLQIEELVNLIDQEKFVQIRFLADDLEKRINASADPDLQMRFYGTMGQAHCYGVLSNIQGFCKDKALCFFKKALSYATILESEPEIAHDLNYIHLWYALFEPESPREEAAFNDAKEHIQRNLIQRPATAEKNKKFLLRQKIFALYRAVLSGKDIPLTKFEAYRFNAESWIKAVTCKYRAVLYAAQGDLVSAKELFTQALDAISHECDYGISCKIKMTIYAEAVRFLSNDYQHAAQRFLTEHPDLMNSAENLPWCDLINGKSTQSPGLTYWY